MNNIAIEPSYKVYCTFAHSVFFNSGSKLYFIITISETTPHTKFHKNLFN
jgi:hypothetical protein